MDLLASPELAVAMFRESNDALFVVDSSDQLILDANPTALRLTGYGKQALAKMPWANLITASTSEQSQPLAHTLAESGFVHLREGYELVCKDGRQLPVSVSGCRTRASDRDVELWILRDISDRVRVEQALQRAHEELETKIRQTAEQHAKANRELTESEQRFRLAFESAPFGMCLMDLECVVIRVNRQFLSIVGYEEDELLGTNVNELLHPEDKETSPPVVAQQIIDSLQVISRECRYVTKSGQVRWICQTDSVVCSSDQKPLYRFRIAEDISAQKKAEEEYEKLSAKVQYTQKLESLGILAGGIAHDFNNLLTAIIGNAELALDRLTPFAPVREELEQIQTVAKRAADLCKQMLAYSGRGSFVLRSINLSQLLHEMEHLLRLTVSDEIAIHFNVVGDIPPIEGDVNQVRQLFINLVTNASEAIGGNSGVITIATGVQFVDREYLDETYLDEELPEGLYVYGEVSDTGCGIDGETAERLFDPFFTTKFPGRGLGLAAALGIVRGHRGAIKVYSDVGRGTTMKVLFPAITQPSEPPLNPAAPKNPALRGTVLVVDDEPTVRNLVQRIMEKRGFRVLLAENGLKAIELFREHRDQVAIVLLDMTMPSMTGEEVFRELKRIDPNVRVVLSSGYNEEDATSRFAGTGLTGFLQKPYSPAALWQTLEDALYPGK